MTATCACGQATIVLSHLATMHGICHCLNCKRRTGSAFGISAYFDRSAVVEKTGETAVYAFTHSSRAHEQQRHFCKACGTTLFWFVSTLQDKIGIAGGCLAGEEGAAEPNYTVSTLQKVPYVTLPSEWKAWP